MSDVPFYETQPDSLDHKHIPGNYGLPLIGCSIPYYKDWDEASREHIRRYGSVSRLQMGPFKGINITHPDHLQKVLLDPDKNISNKMGWAKSLGIFFEGGLALRDFDEHKAHRRVFQTGFKTDAMRVYTGITRDVLEGYLDKWGELGRVNFVDALREPLLDMASKILFGFTDLKGEENKKLTQAFSDVICKGTTGVVKWDIPGFKHHTGMKANRYLDEYIASLIEERRAGDGQDFMSHVVKERTEEGHYFSDKDIVAHLKFLMFASFDTTSITLLHIMVHLALNQELQDKVRQEAIDSGKEFLDYDDLDSMDLMDHCVMEGTRMYPAVTVLFRRTIRECEIGGYRIPAHSILFLDLRAAQRSDQYWTNPHEFDPERWGPERAEHKTHSFSYAGFGGGAHKCMGMHFAKMEIKLFLHRLLLRYRIRTPEGYVPDFQTIPLPTLNDGAPIIFEKI